MASSPQKQVAKSGLLNWILEHESPFQSPNRLASLYSDFLASRASNPDGYAANVAAWRAALAHACRAGITPSADPAMNTFVVRTGPTLAAALERRDVGRPSAGLKAVQEDSLEQKYWFRREDFLQRKQSVYWKPWLGIAVPAAEDVFVFLMKKAGLAADTRLTREGEFVILANVEEASERVLARREADAAAAGPSAAVYSLETFIAAFADVLDDDGDGRRLSMPEMSILLAHLYRDKKAIDMSHADKTGTTTIKFAKITGTPDPIEESDTTVAHVKTLLRGLERQVATLQAKIAECEETARQAVRQGSGDVQKKRALAALRAKKFATETLSKREASKEQLERVLLSIDEAVGQKEMVTAMEASATVLETLNQEIGGAEKVQQVMDKVAEGMADVDEVNQVLSEPGMTAVDEDEVDEELETMIKEMTPPEEKPAREQPAQETLPNVPTTEPERSAQIKQKTAELSKDMGNMSL